MSKRDWVVTIIAAWMAGTGAVGWMKGETGTAVIGFVLAVGVLLYYYREPIASTLGRGGSA